MKSIYSLQFEVWFNRFPKTQFHILFMEDFMRDPLGSLETTLDFFGVPMLDGDEGKWGYPTRQAAMKVLGKEKNKTPQEIHKLRAPTEETHEVLDKTFAPFNCYLAQQLGLVRAAEGHWVTGQVSSSLGSESHVPWLTDWGPKLEKAAHNEGGAENPCLMLEEALKKKLLSLLS